MACGRAWGRARSPPMSTGLVVAIAMALAFAFTNGVHDAANAIATLVATRAARPGSAVLLAAVGNVLGPLLLGTAVASTIAGIVTVPSDEVIAVLGAALTGAVAWNGITWWRGLPSSSGHALLGGLVGAALAVGGARRRELGRVRRDPSRRGPRCDGGAHDRAGRSGSPPVSSSTAARGVRRGARRAACAGRCGQASGSCPRGSLSPTAPTTPRRPWAWSRCCSSRAVSSSTSSRPPGSSWHAVSR